MFVGSTLMWEENYTLLVLIKPVYEAYNWMKHIMWERKYIYRRMYFLHQIYESYVNPLLEILVADPCIARGYFFYDRVIILNIFERIST